MLKREGTGQAAAPLTGREGQAGQEGRATLGTAGTFGASSPSRPSCPPSPMRRYPRYKPTGLAWIPSVPEHWEVRKAKFLIRVGNGSDPKTDGDIPVYGSGAASFKTCGEYKEGPCVLVGRKGATLHIPHYVDGKYWNVDTSFDVKTTSGDYSLRYYYYCATRFDYQYYIAQTTLPGMAKSDYLNMPLPVPPLSEQDRIVRYLDEKTAAIDELVRAKEREIDLLRERKQALVSDAVTGGAGNLNTETQRHGAAKNSEPLCLRASVLKTCADAGDGVGEINTETQRHRGTESKLAGLPEFRDSSVPWIGKIPKDWVVVKLSRRYSVQLGKMLDAKKIKGQSLMPYLRNQDVQWGGVNSEGLPKMDFSAEEQVRFGVRKGDLLVCEGGEIGRSAIWESDKPCCFQKAIIRLRPRKPAEDTVRFMWYLMFAATANHAFDFATGKATIAHLPAEKLSAALFAFPPLPEQERIVAHLDSVCSELDAAEAAIRKQIALLQELRTRLVSDAVTGVVEV